MDALSGLLRDEADDEVVTDACWALSYVSDGDPAGVRAVIDKGLIPRLVQLLGSPSLATVTPAMRTLGNVVTGTDVQTQAAIDAGLLPALIPLLSSPKRTLRKEAMWTLSNITAGTPAQIQAALDSGIMQRVVELFPIAPHDVQREASWVVSNACAGGTPAQIAYLVEAGIMPVMISGLSSPDARIITVCLEALDNILGSPRDEEAGTRLKDMFEGAGGLDAVEQLQTHQDEGIYQRAVGLLTKHFDAEEEDEAEIGAGPPGAADAFAVLGEAGEQGGNDAQQNQDDEDEDDDEGGFVFG
jgi:hypothetical protein